MKRATCRRGETQPGTATVTPERDGMTLVARGVPAQVCEAGGEEGLDEETLRHALEIAERAAQAGIQAEIREYKAA